MNTQDFFERYKWKGAKDSIGSGGFGKVFRVEDTLRNRQVAIKNACVDSHKFTLKREVELVNEIEPHPHILRYENYYRFEVNNEWMDYAIMPFYQHGNLTNVIHGELLNDAQKMQVARGVVKGLAHLHKNKIVHRDLKPSNILMDLQDGSWVPKVADFGLSRFKADAEISVSNSSVGRSMPYAAPEQLTNGGKVNLYTDIWALGTILYELYAGQRAFQSDGSKTSSADVQLYHQIVEVQLPVSIKELPDPIREIVTGCLLSEGKNRLTIQQVSNLLDASNDLTEVVNRNEILSSNPAKQLTSRISQIGLKPIFIAAGLVIGIVSLAAYLLWQKQDYKLKEAADNKIVNPVNGIKVQDSSTTLMEKKVVDPKRAIFSGPAARLEPKRDAGKRDTLYTHQNKLPKTSVKVVSSTLGLPASPAMGIDKSATAIASNVPIQVEIKTNKGHENNNFAEGENMKLFFKVNAPGFVRFVYRLADGNLVLLYDDYEVPPTQTNTWLQVGKSFTCTAPFGSEEIIVFTSTAHFNPLRTRQDNGYTIIEEGLPTVLAKSRTRGMKAKRDPVITTKSMNIITKGNS